MCILGAIKEINELELVISLPNGLTGFVSITEISEEISKIAEKVANDDEDEVMFNEKIYIIIILFMFIFNYIHFKKC